ncbi:hypothetical protein GCM10007301_01770 [Azorhizobium oxalatiphilum]|uniref:Glycosyltransferase RgtA/B/C/D-like domain-containing protein n=1 Tax=Azorhizobium oxalatiphilum TaxID=980631 RepID=A0A917BJV7_9HYPH|nr:hypothetical protein [Azorhizobium oxalatiphilum]GGF45925.1 hypothetical protein GCM10007301_01770 [Azorhizobium oxalatiphilum]
MDIGQAETSRAGRAGGAALLALLFLIFVALAVIAIAVQQRAMGGYTSEISATNADEASHFISGLMIADYVRAGFPSPLAFAKDYYFHYPKVAIGHWPPLYYMAEGALFLALPPLTSVALLLPAVLAALLVVTAGWITARVLGPLQGLAVAAVMLALPLLREATLVIVLDLPVALLGLFAALAYARFMRTVKAWDGVLFAVLASAAILTKGTGAALALLPPLAVLFGGRFDLLKRRAFWIPLPIVALLAGPWTLGTYGMAAAGFQYKWGAAFAELAARTYAQGLGATMGGLLLLLAAVGLVFAIARGWRRGAGSELWVALAALVVAVGAFQCLVPAGLDARYLLPLSAPLVMLAAFGLQSLIRVLTRGWPTIVGLVVALVLLVAALPALMTQVQKRPIGMDAAAQALLARQAANPLVLVGADAMGEGALISAVAQHDRARKTIVLRGTKMLAQSDWNAASYTPTYADAAALMKGLDEMGVGFVVVDTSPASQDLLHDRQLLEAAQAYPDRFQLIASYPRADGKGEARLYALTGNEAKVPDVAALKDRLGKGF